MQKTGYDIIVDHKCQLGEGPVWDEQNHCIWWVDILDKKIHQYKLHSKHHEVITLEEMPGSIALIDNSELLVAVESGIILIDRKTKSTEKLVTIHDKQSGLRFNDGKCDPYGNFWVGTMALTGYDKKGCVYMFDSDKNISVKIADTKVSNGMAWDENKEKFYFIDTPTQQVVSYDFNINGKLKNKRIVIKIPDDNGKPDGMTIDTEGMLWVAMWGGGKIMRWNPTNGELLDEMQLPVSQVTSCTFGGKEMNDIYVTSALTGLSEQEIKEQPQAGCLFVLSNTRYYGLPPNKYKSKRTLK